MARPTYEFNCSSCGELDTLPFEPKGEVKCKDCFRAEREIRRRHAPIQTHNTRVMLPIQCYKCGKEETLDHMPKGKKLSELMCSECTEETLGVKSRWNDVRQQKRDENQRSWRVSCDECSISLYVSARPSREKEYICESCEKEHVRARGDALQGTDEIGGGVHKRVKKSFKRRVYTPDED
jgi:CxxC-x17-CxxC domain-containing protein